MFLFSIPYIFLAFHPPKNPPFLLPIPRHFLQVDQRIVHPSQVPFQVEAQSEVSRSRSGAGRSWGFSWENGGKMVENHGIIMGMENVWNVGMIMGLSWDDHGKIMEFHGMIMGNMFGKLHKKKIQL